ncbi:MULTISPECIES: ribonuclease domain-containing protein [unclassified Streptomyces]|uniref:ribonuclease domain-containing protein n=1 Tax=unclassified Streptomyces TaxID=2593676 RepID=UPI0006AEDE64|nr:MULTISPECIES: ribonuclease domain-containing protein [unclassified Streptomyces]KOX25856.1 guanine-specific ribonuclease N1 and T1 [Streptomyces sp. NRRL F-6491]KOX42177.1 guanine-specific ribonuclease N1 and T1 [Streptomyces sp. NRRL F-6492]
MLLRPPRVLLALVLSVLLGGFLAGCSPAAGGGARTAAPTRTPATAAPTGASGLPVVRAADLPPEARGTLDLIARGGPYPYAKDGTVFSDFEKALPREERGYYREYTVKTPGERDRGARRLVVGRGGETYYTDDHYETFREVVADEA